MAQHFYLKYRERDYTQQFEYRPELLFDQIVPQVIDASHVRERRINELMVVRIEDVLIGNNETFLVFGKPNTALVIPNENNSGYKKFAAYSLWRQKAEITNITRNNSSFVQSGIWLRFIDIPPKALYQLREAMIRAQGHKYRTCVNGNMHVLDWAGFTSGKKKLSNITWPYQLLNTLLKNGLEFEGISIQFEVIRTTRLSMEDYTRSIIYAEIATPWRYYQKSKIGRLVLKSKRKGTSKNPAPYEVAPSLPSNIEYREDINIRVTHASTPAQVLRQIWGPHALFEVLVDRTDIDKYFSEALRPFPQKNPNLITRLKRNLLFSKPIILLIRSILGTSTFEELGRRSERDIYNMLRTHSGDTSNKYNIVVVRMPPVTKSNNSITRLIISRITVRSKFIDWVLSKHVLMSGYLWTGQPVDLAQKYVVWAGEVWKTTEGKLMLSGNSGTYQPSKEKDNAMITLAQELLPNLQIELWSETK